MEEDTIFQMTVDAESADAGFARLESMMTAFQEQLDEAAAAAEEASGAIDDALANIGASAEAASAPLDAVATEMDGVATASGALGDAAPAAAAGLDEVATSADAAAASMDGAAAATAGADTSLGALNFGPLSMMGLAAVVAGGAFVKMGADGTDALQRVQALTGASDQQMSQYSSAIEQMAGKYGKSVKDMSGGLYDIVSVGFQGADALNTLKVASQAAAAGGVDLHTVTSGLTSIMKAYGVQGKDAASVMDTLLLGVRDGKASFQDYSNAIGLVATTAKGAGFSLNESAAALSTLTAVFPSARLAGMDLRHLLTTVGVNAAAVGASAQKMGLHFDAAKFASLGLQGRLQYLQSITHGNQAEMLKLTGGTAGYAAAQVLLANKSKDFSRNLDDMKNKTGSTQKAFDSWNKSVGAHAQDMVGSLSAVAAQFVVMAGPAVIGGLDALSGMFSGIAKWLSHLDMNSAGTRATLIVLAGVIGGILVFALTAAAIAAWAFLTPILIAAAPFIAVGLAIGIVVAGIYLLTQHWKSIGSWLSTEWTQIVRAVGGTFIAFGQSVLNLSTTVRKGVTHAVEAFGKFFVDANTAVHHGWDVLANGFTGGVKHLVELNKRGFQTLYNDATGFMTRVRTGVQRELNTAKEDVHRITTALHTLAVRDWQNIEHAIISPVESATARVHKTFDTMRSNVTGVFHALGTDIQRAFNGYISFVAGIEGRMTNTVHASIVGPIEGTINGIIGWMFNAGKNAIQMLTKGIQNEVGSVKNAVGNVAHTISSFLGFHSPTEEGPGADADKWMPALGQMLVDGLQSQVGRVRAQATAIAHAVSSGIQSANTQLNVASAPTSASAPLSATVPLPALASSGGLYAGATSAGGLAGLGALGGGNTAVLALLAQIASGVRERPLGATPQPAQLGSVSQQFSGPLNFTGVQNIAQLYAQLSTLGGLALEDSLRGASAGSAF